MRYQEVAQGRKEVTGGRDPEGYIPSLCLSLSLGFSAALR